MILPPAIWTIRSSILLACEQLQIEAPDRGTVTCMVSVRKESSRCRRSLTLVDWRRFSGFHSWITTGRSSSPMSRHLLLTHHLMCVWFWWLTWRSDWWSFQTTTSSPEAMILQLDFVEQWPFLDACPNGASSSSWCEGHFKTSEKYLCFPWSDVVSFVVMRGLILTITVSSMLCFQRLDNMRTSRSRYC